MTRTMTPLLVDVSVRAVLIAAATGGVLLALRIQVPRARHTAWATVVVAMLALPLWSVAGPRLDWRVLPVQESAAAPATPDVAPPARFSEAPVAADTTTAISPAPATAPGGIAAASLLFSVYLAGLVVLLARLAVGTVYALRLRRAAIRIEGHLTSDRCSSPITLGWLAPKLILPVGWSSWSGEQLDVVLAHEQEHARRRDPLTQWLALFNRAVFWFHPLAWWLEARLRLLAEESCDAAVLAAGHSPETYTRCLLDLARSVAASGHRVALVGTPMPGSGLRQRIQQIAAARPSPAMARHRLVFALALCLMCTTLLGTGTLTARDPWTDGQTAPASSGEVYEAATIKPCGAEPPAAEGARSGGSAPINASIGRITIDCKTITQLVYIAYVINGRELVNPSAQGPDRVQGLPAWARDDKFTITAKAAGPADQSTLMGPMLRAFLESRLKLTLHRETREVPVFAMTVAKDGLKMKPIGPEGCRADGQGRPDTPEASQKYLADLTAGGTPMCGVMSMLLGKTQGTRRWVIGGTTLENFARTLSGTASVDRTVIDRTGNTGRFNVDLEFAPDNAADAVGPTIFRALEQQLGLVLTSAKGPSEGIVVDHIERPSSGDATVQVETRPAVVPRFDIVSVKPCAPGARGAERGNAGSVAITSPGRLYLDCYPLSTLFVEAYVFFVDGRAHGLDSMQRTGIEGGPDWMKSDRYTIEAKTAQNPPPAVMRGPMLQAVLEDRFKLKVHRETRQMPTYDLVSAESGAKVSPYTGHDCVIKDNAVWPPAALPAGQRYCGDQSRRDGDRFIRTGVMTLDELAALFSFDRPVVNKTGFTSPIRYRLEWPIEDMKMEEPPAASVVKALRDQLGLDLRASKGPRDFLVIDHAERPARDRSDVHAMPSAHAQGPGR